MSSSSKTSAVDVSKIMALVKLMTWCIDLDKLYNGVFEVSEAFDLKSQGSTTDEHVTNMDNIQIYLVK